MDRIFELVKEAPVLSPEQIYWMIDHACNVDKLSFKVLTILLACLAVLASTARLVFRYRSERTLYLEDWLVLFATVCLIAETGLVYSFSRTLYLIDGATLNLAVLGFIGKDPALTNELLTTGPSTLVAYFTLGWLAIFAIKYSFLALFHKMLRNVSRKLTAYFWCTVAATGMAGAVVILESFILCPHFGADAVISIPILLLRMSRLRIEYKLRIATVLCLSTLCIVLSIIRLAGGIHHNVFGKFQFGTTWVSFMLHCEACVAVMAGSVPALHAVYTSHQHKKSGSQSEEEGMKSMLKSKAMSVMGTLRGTKSTLPTHEVPQSSFVRVKNLRSSIIAFIPRRPFSRASRALSSTPDGRKGSADSAIIHPGLAYHEFRKQEMKGIGVTYECMVVSESAYSRKSLDITEATSHSGTVLSVRGSPEPEISSRRVDLMIDQQFGNISAGMHV